MKDLTRKQAAVMGLIADGKKIIEVAEEQGMAVSTVNTHLERIKQKLGAKTTTQAAVLFDRCRRLSNTGTALLASTERKYAK